MRIRWLLAICLLAWPGLFTLVSCSTISPAATPFPPTPSPAATATPRPTPPPLIVTPTPILEGVTVSGIVTDAYQDARIRAREFLPYVFQ